MCKKTKQNPKIFLKKCQKVQLCLCIYVEVMLKKHESDIFQQARSVILEKYFATHSVFASQYSVKFPYTVALNAGANKMLT